MVKTNSVVRDEIYQSIKRTYLGPVGVTSDGMPDYEEIINFSPKDIYTTGVLYPQQITEENIFIDTEEDNLSSYGIGDDYDNIQEGNSRKKRQHKVIDDEEVFSILFVKIDSINVIIVREVITNNIPKMIHVIKFVVLDNVITKK